MKAESFIEFCLTPEWAAEATLQPIRRFGMDGAIVFADILLVPYGLGQRVDFREREGPVLEVMETEEGLSGLLWNPEKVDAVFKTIDKVKKELSPDKTLIGFAGGPWTVACYMLEGRGKTGFERACRAAKESPVFVEKLLEKIEEASLDYLSRQIEAGAEVIQIFESHAGLLNGALFEKLIVNPTRRIVRELKVKHPLVSIIGFPREAASMERGLYFCQTGLDALSLDQHVSFQEAEKLKAYGALQGNLDPHLLREGGEKMLRKVAEICEALGPRHVFNLGHGVLPDTPPEHVAELVSFVHGWTGTS